MMRDGEGWTPSLRSPRSPGSSRPSSKCDSPRKFPSGDSRDRGFGRSTSPQNDRGLTRNVSPGSTSGFRRQGSGVSSPRGVNERRSSGGSFTSTAERRTSIVSMTRSDSPRERSPRSPGSKRPWKSEDEAAAKEATPKSGASGAGKAQGLVTPKSSGRTGDDSMPLSPKASAKSGSKQPVSKASPIAGVLAASEDSVISPKSPHASPRSKSPKAAGGSQADKKKGRLSFLQAIRG
mmetsp:Transcript_87171/g.220070  ORF Transcript_87171/g.220070 Transcript_87171/m.220070 type:complete len:235 (+) Transcript_87171:2-706(+)